MTGIAAANRRAAGYGGIPYMLCAVVLFITMDTVVKYLAQSYPPPMIVWARYAGATLLILPYFLATPRTRALMRPRSPGRQFFRSALLFGSTSTFFLALAMIPLADAVTLMFVTPLMVCALAGLILGERVGPRRWAGVLIGFVGVAIVLRPGFGFAWAYLLPLASALFYAIYQVMTRAMSATENTTTTFFYTAAVGAALATLYLPFFGRWPMNGIDAALMLLAGACGGFGHLLVIVAFSRSEASLVSQFSYTGLVWATLFGWIAFGALPDEWTYAGAAVIVGAGLYVWHRERVAARRPSP
jgi:drug/metabolite transporter (DMT)-like permease